MFERAFGLEQRRDVDLVVDAEQLARNRARRAPSVGCSHSAIEHADRRVGIDMARGSAPSRGTGGRRCCSRSPARRSSSAAASLRRASRASCTSAAWLARSSLPSGSMRRRIAFCSCEAFTRKWIQPMPSPSARIAAAATSRPRAVSGSAAARLVLQLGDDRRQADELVGMVGGQRVGGGGDRGGIGQVGAEELRPSRSVCWPARASRSAIAGRGVSQALGIARQPQRLLDQAIAHRGRPADVGAAVHVVADPAGEPERHRLEAAPALGPARARRCRTAAR